MNQSEQINELVTALSKVQGKMKPAVFNKKNPHFNHKYADFTSCMEACRDLLCEHGLCIMQCMEQQEGRYVLVTILAHPSGQWIKSFFPVIPKNNDSQSLGSALSYAKRYGLTSLLGIVSDDEDDDANAASDKQSENRPQKINKAQYEILSKKLDLLPSYKAQVIEWLKKQKIYHLLDMEASMFEGVMKEANKALELQNEKKPE